MPARILYVNQTGVITTSDGITYNLPVQNASCEVTRPIEDVLTLGRLGSIGRIQNGVSTCKADLKIYLNNTTGGGNNNSLTPTMINKLTGDALSATLDFIGVGPNGFSMSGILQSLGIEGSATAFATADLSFAGVGDPVFAAPPSVNIAASEAAAAVLTSCNPVTTTNITGSVGLGCANSVRFSLDLPNEVISCVGTNPSGTQSAIAAGFIIGAKPPFRASIQVEGASVEPLAAVIAQTFYFGKIGVQIPNGIATNQSFNQAVGNIGANYSYTVEGVSAVFSQGA